MQTVEEKRAARAAYMRDWSARNPERARANRRASRNRTIEKRRAYDREYYARDPQRQIDAAQAWAETHREQSRATKRAWNAAHRAATRAYRRDWMNELPTRAAAVRAASTANARAAMYGADGQIGYETVLELWRREPACVDCREGRGLDHVIPLSRGGSNTSGNLANRCRFCNSRKGARLPEEISA